MFGENAWRVQVQGMGVVTGVDTSRAADRLRRLGMDGDVADELLAACEIGLVKAYSEKESEADGQQEP